MKLYQSAHGRCANSHVGAGGAAVDNPLLHASSVTVACPVQVQLHCWICGATQPACLYAAYPGRKAVS